MTPTCQVCHVPCKPTRSELCAVCEARDTAKLRADNAAYREAA